MGREEDYKEEEYWSDVAARIKERSSERKVAGDSDPYHIYKRKQFLNHFSKFPLRDKHVLEVGPGPGGNIELALQQDPASATGIDISEEMLAMARARLPDHVQLLKTDGTTLPIDDNSVDISYTVTVLQHVTSPGMVEQLLAEISRVTDERIFLCERTEESFQGNDLNHGRTINFYKNHLSPHGFELVNHRFLNIQASYLICGVIRRLFNNPWRSEGQAPTLINQVLQKTFLPLSKMLDPLITQERDLTIMEFRNVKITN